jgi:hypothetical protein
MRTFVLVEFRNSMEIIAGTEVQKRDLRQKPNPLQTVLFLKKLIFVQKRCNPLIQGINLLLDFILSIIRCNEHVRKLNQS